jgi:uncharacterized protein
MKKYWKMIVNVIMFMGVWYFLFAGIMLSFQKLSTVSNFFKDMLSKYFFISYLIMSCLGLLCVYLIFKFRKINMFKFCHIEKIPLKSFLLAAGYGIAVGTFSSCFAYMDFFKNTFPSIGGYFISLTSMNFLLYFVIVGSDSVLKETLFRGSILNELHQKIPLTLAILIQAIMYGCMLFYSDVPTRIYGVAGNILFALIYVLMGSVLASITVQLCCYVTMFAFGQNGFGHALLSQFDIFFFVASVIIILIPIYYYVKRNKPISMKFRNQAL